MGTADKLRNFAAHWATHEADKILALEAAEELERLQDENRRLRPDYPTDSAISRVFQ